METYFIFALLTLFNSKPTFNPVYIDLIKVFVGTTLWIGGLAIYMYRRERKLKLALNK